MRPWGALKRVDGKSIAPDAGDLRIEANWGFLDRAKNVMAGHGSVVERVANDIERNALVALGLDPATMVFDVFLNERTFWTAIPRPVWDMVIGGHLVMKKWLSYRDFRVLGRDLTVSEAREVEAMARRLTALCALAPALDTNYRRCALDAYSWSEPHDDTD